MNIQLIPKKLKNSLINVSLSALIALTQVIQVTGLILLNYTNAV